MKLYHYSKARVEELLTLRQQKAGTPEANSFKAHDPTTSYHPAGYADHLSFFFERPPIESLASVFQEGHPVWYKGNDLYEYIVETRDNDQFKYVLVESPERTAHYYDESYTDDDLQAWHKQELKILQKHNYIGEGSQQLERATRHLQGSTLSSYQQLRLRPNFEEIRLKYAATVPHVMLYPTSGKMPISQTHQVTVGNKPISSIKSIPKW